MRCVGIRKQRIVVFLQLCAFLLVLLVFFKVNSTRFKIPSSISPLRKDELHLVVKDYNNLAKNYAAKNSLNEGQQKVFRDIFNLSGEIHVQIGRDNSTDGDKYFIYRCDERNLCGGWMDRIRGAMAGYLIANLTGRTFKIDMPMKSCDIYQFIIPNHVDWHLPFSLHKTIRSDPDISLLVQINKRNLFHNNRDIDFWAMPSMKAKFVYYKGNKEYCAGFQQLRRYTHQLAWMTNLTEAEIANAVYRRLFRPSAYLQRKTKSFLEKHLQPRDKLVCAHMRTGRNPTIPNDLLMYKMSRKGISNSWTFLRAMTSFNDSKIFFMTDRETLVEKAKKLPFGDKFFFSPGRIVHIDRSPRMSPEKKCEGLEKIIFEHYILLHCDTLLISRSGIGINAAFLRNTDDGLYCLRISGTIGPCKRSELATMYNFML